MVSWVFILFPYTPDLIHRIALTGKSLVVPGTIDQLIVKFQTHTRLGIVAGKELDALCVFAIHRRIGASAGSHELLGFCVVGYPLKARA